jgi:hypothetical protein
MTKSVLHWIALILVIIGGLNWGLVALSSFNGIVYTWDLVALVIGSVPWLAAIVYILVGLSAIYLLITTIFAR